METHTVAVRYLPHVVYDGGLYGSVQPLVSGLFALLHVELVDVVAEHLAHACVSGLEPLIGSALHAEELRCDAVGSGFVREAYECRVVVACSDDVGSQAQSNVYADVGEALNGCEAGLRRWYPFFYPLGLFCVGGDDADFDVPVVRVPGEKFHVSLILRPPCRLGRKGEGVVYLVEVAKEFEGDAVPALVLVELVREAAPLHDAPVSDVGEELDVCLVRGRRVVHGCVLEKGYNLLRVDAARLGFEVALDGVAFLEE